jgi:hypothetical protein
LYKKYKKKNKCSDIPPILLNWVTLIKKWLDWGRKIINLRLELYTGFEFWVSKELESDMHLALHSPFSDSKIFLSISALALSSLKPSLLYLGFVLFSWSCPPLSALLSSLSQIVLLSRWSSVTPSSLSSHSLFFFLFFSFKQNNVRLDWVEFSKEKLKNN